MTSRLSHCVAVIGGAVSGSEAAYQLAQKGIRVVLFEQNALPYGKLEDGLPKWHAKLRDSEEKKINKKLDNPLIRFVPSVRLGKDVGLKELADTWGFSAVMLATGALRDRPLPVNGIEDLIGKGLYYQNPFFYWFNHFEERNYNGPQLKIVDNASVIGGGLSSIDVAKAIMMITVKEALAKQNIITSIGEMERGIDAVLRKHGIQFEDLGLKGCTLYYRRRAEDMPLVPKVAADPEMEKKLEQTRKKILQNAQRKFFFNFKGLHSPFGYTSDNGQLSAVHFHRKKFNTEKLEIINDDDVEVQTPLVISSIGSLPEIIPGIPSDDGVAFKLKSKTESSIYGFENVVALGNAVTGRGNIKESHKHSQAVSKRVTENYLDKQEQDFNELLRLKETQSDKMVQNLTETLQQRPLLTAEVSTRIDDNVTALQKQAGYNGNFMEWVNQHIPQR